MAEMMKDLGNSQRDGKPQNTQIKVLGFPLPTWIVPNRDVDTHSDQVQHFEQENGKTAEHPHRGYFDGQFGDWYKGMRLDGSVPPEAVLFY